MTAHPWCQAQAVSGVVLVILGSMRPLRMFPVAGIAGGKGINAPGVCQSTDF